MRKVSIPISQRFADLARGPLVVLVWAAAAGGAAWLLQDRAEPALHLGWVPPVEIEVTAPASGTIVQVLVRPLQDVRRGQAVARLDPRPLEARLETARARVLELEARLEGERLTTAATLAAARAELSREASSERFRWEGELRRYVTDETGLALDGLAVEVELASDRAEVDRLAVQLRRAEELAAEGSGPESDVQDLALLKAQVEARIESNAELLERTRSERAAAAERRRAFEGLAPDAGEAVLPPGDLPALQAAVRVQSLAVAELELERERLALVSPVEGRVARLLVGEGQAVPAGRAVLTVRAVAATEAVVYLDEHERHEDLVGRRVTLTTQGPEPRTIESAISAVAPGFEALPERLWPAPSLPRYGRAARVPLGAGAGFLPGEVLSARLDPLD